MERVREEGEEAEEEEARDWRDIPRPRGGPFARFGGLERQCRSGNWSNGMHLGLWFFLAECFLASVLCAEFSISFLRLKRKPKTGKMKLRTRRQQEWHTDKPCSAKVIGSFGSLPYSLVYSSLIHLDRRKKRKKRRLLLHQMIKKKKRKSRGATLVKTGQEQQCVILQWEMLSIWCYAIINHQAKVQSGRKPCYGLKFPSINACVFDKCLLKFEHLSYSSEWSLGRFLQLILFCTPLNQKWWLPWGSWIWRLDSIRRGTL